MAVKRKTIKLRNRDILDITCKTRAKNNVICAWYCMEITDISK